ncbi:hypothetical protein BOX15_Mlig013346g2 [Macrostomum lignano]|uniref:Uncharacterized protein n=2 Tax=Macrostomum lignano TaxID=282301 RepID=A0A267FW16_9PLAT|nr:hypothetical protein BOX15_Mlig013346g1 [Macrostomum lignano]PAA77923.1 hypothetical protein BOX15_Mlig013346g2 [Macrostomum lignano]
MSVSTPTAAAAAPHHSKQISFDKIASAAQRLRDRLHRTPVMTSRILDAMSSRQLYFKCEHLQRTGSFKARGALNAVLCLLEEARENGRATPAGVATHSSGNHGQALAWAARECGLTCCVVVPEGTSPAKTAAIRAYGAEIFLCQPNMRARRQACARLAEERGLVVVPPFDDYRVMAGQGTVALELLEQVAELDAVLVPISGGGLSSGIAVACRHLKPELRVHCVEPAGKGLAECLAARQPLWPNPDAFLTTIADGLRLQSAGELTFPVLCDLAQPVVLSVSDAEMALGCRLAFRYLKQVIEPASAAALHAAVFAAADRLPDHLRHIGVVLTGGNLDPDTLPSLLAMAGGSE